MTSNSTDSVNPPPQPFFFDERTVQELLTSTKSQGTSKVTECHVRHFVRFLMKIADLSEESAQQWIRMPEGELTDYLRNFFAGLKKQTDGKDVQPSYLRNIFSSIQRVLKENDRPLSKISIDRLDLVMRARLKELKKRGEGSLPHARDELTTEELQLLFTEKCAGPHNPRALQNAIAIFLLLMGKRGRGELYATKLGDLAIITLDGVRHLVLQREGQTKTRQGDNLDTRRSPKLAEMPQCPAQCPVALFEKLQKKRPETFCSPDSPLFLKAATVEPRVNFEEGYRWFHGMRMGVHLISKIVSDMVNKSSIISKDRNIGNTSLRKTLGSTLLRHHLPPKTIMNMLGHSNPNSVARYDCTPADTSSKVNNVFLHLFFPVMGKLSSAYSIRI